MENTFWSKVNKTNTCWLWIGGKTKDGYGTCSNGYAHRQSWKIHYGDIPRGLLVLHTCDIRNCVNPNHLWLGTILDNIKDRDNKIGNPKVKKMESTNLPKMK